MPNHPPCHPEPCAELVSVLFRDLKIPSSFEILKQVQDDIIPPFTEGILVLIEKEVSYATI